MFRIEFGLMMLLLGGLMRLYISHKRRTLALGSIADDSRADGRRDP